MNIDRELFDYRDHARRPSVGPRVYRTSPTIIIACIGFAVILAAAFAQVGAP